MNYDPGTAASDDAPPRVFVVNLPVTNEGTELISLRPARAFGEIVHVLTPGQPPSHPRAMLAEMRENLAGFRARDYLLPVGSAVAIACAGAVAAAESGGRVRLLKWHGIQRTYDVIEVDLSEEIGEVIEETARVSPCPR